MQPHRRYVGRPAFPIWYGCCVRAYLRSVLDQTPKRFRPSIGKTFPPQSLNSELIESTFFQNTFWTRTWLIRTHRCVAHRAGCWNTCGIKTFTMFLLRRKERNLKKTCMVLPAWKKDRISHWCAGIVHAEWGEREIFSFKGFFKKMPLILIEYHLSSGAKGAINHAWFSCH